MIARGRGTMLFTGATAGVKAGPKSVSFGPAKFAMRGLAQSLARDLGPRGIHVAWINVDGGIDIWFACGLHPNFPPVISRVRRLFRPSWGASFVVLVSCSSQFFRPPFTL